MPKGFWLVIGPFYCHFYLKSTGKNKKTRKNVRSPDFNRAFKLKTTVFLYSSMASSGLMSESLDAVFSVCDLSSGLPMVLKLPSPFIMD
jgi:hypothetical protein